MYYKEDLEPYKKRGIQLLNLRNLTRQHKNITGIYVQTKLQFQAVLDQVFPVYRGVFWDLYSVVSLSSPYLNFLHLKVSWKQAKRQLLTQ